MVELLKVWFVVVTGFSRRFRLNVNPLRIRVERPIMNLEVWWESAFPKGFIYILCTHNVTQPIRVYWFLTPIVPQRLRITQISWLVAPPTLVLRVHNTRRFLSFSWTKTSAISFLLHIFSKKEITIFIHFRYLSPPKQCVGQVLFVVQDRYSYYCCSLYATSYTCVHTARFTSWFRAKTRIRIYRVPTTSWWKSVGSLGACNVTLASGHNGWAIFPLNAFLSQI